MDSTIGKYEDFVPIDSMLNGRNKTENSKVIAQSHGETTFETPPRCDENRAAESRNPISFQDNTHFTPSRQVSEDEISARERAQREEQESLELARALMAEEAMASYAQSMDYLHNNQDQFSEEDLAALQTIMDEDQQQHEVEMNADVEEALDDDENGDAYEFMLQLGERIGDVKSERWAQVAQQKIDNLSVVVFDPDKIKLKKELNDCDVKCLICQEEYNKGEKMRQLPCGHCFRKDCIDQWLLHKDFCPYCRTPLEKA
mmetsp:Transcript_11883/g.28153  ORF Transcript_11883/g.28153 Transcript_11883/m.28153 type:complete len:259 (-) Transcript_11883:1198-1974(-)|eukprot:CAMPEP_0197199394 /NCGR_PEP_ID=MMETSP1423-20130617/33861_1 /TAXON_ID=476441 /ORGANISM="Pseudo-nitzschia heimii, Strain UNC1101" /LENGTH=258 /DNA_ID=CAMNT_0042653249 /DNA_START=6 /DNA_END=782 /DNA_ORIENTATION=-